MEIESAAAARPSVARESASAPASGTSGKMLASGPEIGPAVEMVAPRVCPECGAPVLRLDPRAVYCSKHCARRHHAAAMRRARRDARDAGIARPHRGLVALLSVETRPKTFSLALLRAVEVERAIRTLTAGGRLTRSAQLQEAALHRLRDRMYAAMASAPDLGLRLSIETEHVQEADRDRGLCRARFRAWPKVLLKPGWEAVVVRTAMLRGIPASVRASRHERENRPCRRCGEPVLRRPGSVFCSDGCRCAHHNELEKAKREAARAGLRCEQCGGHVPAKRGHRRFCGRPCQDAARAARKKTAQDTAAPADAA